MKYTKKELKQIEKAQKMLSEALRLMENATSNNRFDILVEQGVSSINRAVELCEGIER